MENNEVSSNDSQLLPFSNDAEQAVLGALLINPEVFSSVAEIIKPDYCYLPQHKAIAD